MPTDLSKCPRIIFTIRQRHSTNAYWYTAGYNRFRQDNPEDIPSDCKDKSWIRDINHIDLLAYYLGLGLKAKQYFVKEVGSAQPPSRLNQPPAPEDPTISSTFFGRSLVIGQRSRDGKQWLGDWFWSYRRRWVVVFQYTLSILGERGGDESHLTIQWKLDVYGHRSSERSYQHRLQSKYCLDTHGLNQP